MAKTTTYLDKLVRSLKVESIYKYTILYQSASINRWGHWKTRDLGVWHEASKAFEAVFYQVSSTIIPDKITSNEFLLILENPSSWTIIWSDFLIDT